MKRRITFFLLLLSVSLKTVVAEPTVIYNNGRTFSLKDKYAIEGSQTIAFGQQWLSEHEDEFINSSPYKRTWLPLKTNMVSRQKYIQRPVNYPEMKNPICIVGADEFSLYWISKSKDYLKQTKSVCWIVQANDEHEFNTVARALSDVMFMPADGDAISAHYKIDFYPALLTDRYISQ